MVRIRPTDSSGGGGDANSDEKADIGGDRQSDQQQSAVTAQMGTIRAGLDPQGGDQNIANDAFAAVGTTPDAVISTDDNSPDVVAEGGGFDNPSGSSGQRRKDVVVETPEGGAAVQTQDNEVVSLGPKASRLSSLVSGGSNGSGSSGSAGSGESGGMSSASETVQRALSTDALPAPLRPGSQGQGAGLPLSTNGGGGGLLDKLTSPLGLVATAVTVGAVAFVASNDDRAGRSMDG